MSNYLFFMKFEVIASKQLQFEAALDSILKAHQESNEGRQGTEVWLTYVGAGDTTFAWIPMKNVGEMDGWKHSVDIVRDVYGDQGDEILRDLADACSSWETRILLKDDFTQR